VHELSLSSAIVDTVVQHAAGRRVTRVTMTIGALRQVVPDSLDFYFGIVSRDTVCEGAELEQRLVPGRARCRGCGREWELEVPAFLCGACGGEAEVRSGAEFEVDTIEVEEEACTAPR
jgi:hydrogenase nickel incorporation protein HypA/HybF